MKSASDLSKTQAQISQDKAVKEVQDQFDQMEITDEDLAEMDPKNMLRAMFIMKEDIEEVMSRSNTAAYLLKSMLDRLKAIEIMVEMMIKTDPEVVSRILNALPPESRDEALAIIAKEGGSFGASGPTAATVSAPAETFRPGTYL